jgi:glutamate/aspartate transport system substrate-binding protein
VLARGLPDFYSVLPGNQAVAVLFVTVRALGYSDRGFSSTEMSAMNRLIVLLVLLAAPAFAPAQALDGTLKKIAGSKTVTIAYRTDALPFAYENESKEPAGYSVELCQRVVANLERHLKAGPLKIKWVKATSQNRLELVRTKQADMECGSTSVTLSRMADVDFSSYIFVDSTGLLARSVTGAKSFKELAGKRVAVIAKTTNQTALESAVKQYAVNATVVPVKDRAEGVAALESGSVDAFASDKLLLLGLAGKMKTPAQYSLLADDLSFEPYAIVLPRGDANFRLAVNRALAEIYRGTEMVEIFRRAFGPGTEPTPMLVIVYGLGAYAN